MRVRLLALLIILFLVPAAGADVSINEIMYAPNSYWGGENNEWIELFNNGSADADIENWTIDGKSIPYAVVPSQGYLILAKNSTKFLEVYGQTSVRVPFTLSNTGKALYLTASDGSIADIFDYTEYATANLAKNNNHTLEKNASLWLESAADGGTPGQGNNENNETGNFTGNNDASQQSLQSVAPHIEIIRAPSSMKFGDLSSIHAKFYPEGRNFSKVRLVAYVFSPAWIARDLARDEITLRNSPYDSAAAIEISDIAENTTENIILPLFLKCRGDYTEGSYTLRVRGYSYTDRWNDIAEKDLQISVSGENDICRTEKCENKTVYVNKTIEKPCSSRSDSSAMALQHEETTERLEINITAPETVFIGSNFTTTIFLKNNGNSTLDLEVYSYLYEHSTIMSQGWSEENRKWSNPRTANSKKASLVAGNSTIFELVNMPRENITTEKYTFKVRIDDLNNVKKSEERVFLVDVRAPPETGNVNVEIENSSGEDSEKITGMAVANSSEDNKLSFWGRIINKIKSWLD